MKNVIKKQTHYSLLLMRDDREVRTLRVRTSIMRFCFLLFFLLLSCAGASIATGWHYWEKSQGQSARLLVLEQELVETKRNLEQLTNESVLWRNTKSTAPTLKNEEIGAPEPTQTALAPESPTSDILAPLRTPGTDNPPSPADNATAPSHAAATPANNATEAAESTAASTGGTVMPTENATASQGVNPANSTAPASIPLRGRPAPPIEISGFNASITDGQRLRLRYAIVSPSNKTLVGTISYQAQIDNGIVVPLESLSPRERFKITRMKVVEKQAKLPAGISTHAIKQIDLLIELEDGSKVLKSFPMS